MSEIVLSHQTGKGPNVGDTDIRVHSVGNEAYFRPVIWDFEVV